MPELFQVSLKREDDEEEDFLKKLLMHTLHCYKKEDEIT